MSCAQRLCGSVISVQAKHLLVVLSPKSIFRVNLAFASIQCFLHVSIAPESPDFKSAWCKAVTLGQLEIFTFYKEKLKNYKLIIKNKTLIK